MKYLYVAVNLEETGGGCVAVGDAISATIRALEVLRRKAYDGAEAAELTSYGEINDGAHEGELIGDWSISERKPA